MDEVFWQAAQEVASTVLILALTGVLTAVGAAVRAWVKARVGEENFGTAVRVTRAAVLAAEQQGVGKAGAVKRDAAVAWAQRWLSEAGVKMDVDLIVALIEGAVLEEIKRWEETAVGPDQGAPS